jgi:predicted transposase YbfD/YdcC
MVPSEFLQKFRVHWNEMLSSDEGEKIKKILAIDGKTQCGNGNKNQKANHIVSAVDADGFCIGEERTSEKSNEITAIPELLRTININGCIVTIDAMGTQTNIAKQIMKKGADYVLALKGNQGILHEDVRLYFADKKLLSSCAYTKVTEKAHGGIVCREYWQTDDIDWLEQKKGWAGLASIAMTRNTIIKDGNETTETRYFISSLPVNMTDIARAIRGHWMVEIYHWHLDVTLKEDENHTLDKKSAFNMNILRKLALSILKLYEAGKKPLSLKKRRFAIGTNPERHLENILSL